MKTSFMTFACPTYTFDQVVSLAVRREYNGIEFRCDADHKHGVVVESSPAERTEFRRKLDDAGLVACCLATSLQFVRKEAVEEALPRIELARDLGCPGMRVFCGPLPEGTSIDEAIVRVAHSLRRVAERALRAGVRLWLETHDAVSRGAHAGRIVRLANHPAVGINWDNMHPFRNGEPLGTTWEAISPFIQHTHFHDALSSLDRVVIKPFGEGELPIQRMYNLLRFSGYEGFFSGEWFGTQMGPDPDASMAAFRRGLQALEREWQELS
jgi:sugar phosphate isomerase/epimerase